MCLMAVAITSAANAQTLPLNSFETTSEMSRITTNSAQVVQSAQYTTSGGHSVQLTLQPATWPTMYITPATPWNFSGYGGLAVDITNPGSAPVSFAVGAYASNPNMPPVATRSGHGVIPAGRTATFVMSFVAQTAPDGSGMKGLAPLYPGTHDLGLSGTGVFDLSHVYQIRIFASSTTVTQTLYVDNVRLLTPLTPGQQTNGIVDAYGQYTGLNYAGKLNDGTEFPARRAAEEADLASSTTPDSWDQYGAWATGPSLAATGYFRTAQYNNKWWLVAPNGHLFFSVGLAAIREGCPTVTTNRTGMFTSLSTSLPGMSPAGTSGSLATYNHYVANLDRKYGSNADQQWLSTAAARLASWHFNTIGNWSDTRLMGRTTPYTVPITITGSFKSIPGAAGRGTVPDPFDPAFQIAAQSSVSYSTSIFGNAPLCIGYFVNNEPGWPDIVNGDRDSLARNTLAQTAPACYAKAAFLTQLQTRYSTIASLNAAWGTAFASWTAMNAPYTLAKATNATQETDLVAFVLAYARQYFKVVHQTLVRNDAHHLDLGCRFASYSPETVLAAAENADVLSFNAYGTSVDPAQWGFLKSYGKPALVSEFHFGAQDTGAFVGGWPASFDQADRANMYVQYVQSVMASPSFVGCHWFQYTDEPETGRVDGENYNIGFVDVTDTPYPLLVRAAQAVNPTVYTR